MFAIVDFRTYEFLFDSPINRSVAQFRQWFHQLFPTSQTFSRSQFPLQAPHRLAVHAVKKTISFSANRPFVSGSLFCFCSYARHPRLPASALCSFDQ